jgi:hypothetical protein
MSVLTVEEMLLLLEADLDEQLSAFYGGTNQGGRAATSRWLREAYSNLYGKVVDADKSGEWLGAQTTANYTGGATSMPLTTWSATGLPLRIYDLRAGSERIPLVPILDWEDMALRLGSDYLSATSYLATIYGGALRLSPVPTAALSLTLRYAPPATKLYYEPVAGAIPAPPGAGTWLAYVPPFIPDHYEAIPALAVVLALMAEKCPCGEQQQRAGWLERDLLSFVKRWSIQKQTQPSVRINSYHDYRGYSR